MGIPLKADARIDGIDGVADMVSGTLLTGRIAAWRIPRRGMALVVLAQDDAAPMMAAVELDDSEQIVSHTNTAAPAMPVPAQT